MVIKITDHITHCHTNNEGNTIFHIIKPLLDDNNNIEISFKGIDSLTSSFVNSAFIELLDYFSFSYIKSKLNFIDTNSTINRIIKKRFEFETKYRNTLEFKKAI